MRFLIVVTTIALISLLLFLILSGHITVLKFLLLGVTVTVMSSCMTT
jgi:hypothetical protein